MCSFFLLERLRKDSEWFIAGTPVPHRPVVWEYTSADFLLIQARLGRKCLCPITRAQNGLFKTSCLGIFFPILFPSAPPRVLFDFVPHLWGRAGRFSEIMDHMGLEQLKHGSHTVPVTEPPVPLSKSLQLAPCIYTLKLGKCTLITNPVYWPHTLCSVVSGLKAGQEGYRMGKGKPWWIRLVQREEYLGQMFPQTLQIYRSSHFLYGMGPSLYFREHSHFSESWKSHLKLLKQ